MQRDHQDYNKLQQLYIQNLSNLTHGTNFKMVKITSLATPTYIIQNMLPQRLKISLLIEHESSYDPKA